MNHYKTQSKATLANHPHLEVLAGHRGATRREKNASQGFHFIPPFLLRLWSLYCAFPPALFRDWIELYWFLEYALGLQDWEAGWGGRKTGGWARGVKRDRRRGNP